MNVALDCRAKPQKSICPSVTLGGHPADIAWQTSRSYRANDLRHQYRVVVTVDRKHFKLRYFKNLKRRKAYDVAVGMPGHATPRGRFSITDKAVNPDWTATLGWAESELLGKSSQWLLPPDDRHKTLVESGRLAAGRNTVRFESRLRQSRASNQTRACKCSEFTPGQDGTHDRSP